MYSLSLWISSPNMVLSKHTSHCCYSMMYNLMKSIKNFTIDFYFFSFAVSLAVHYSESMWEGKKVSFFFNGCKLHDYFSYTCIMLIIRATALVCQIISHQVFFSLICLVIWDIYIYEGVYMYKNSCKRIIYLRMIE